MLRRTPVAVLLAAMSCSSLSFAGVYQLQPVADTYIMQANPSANKGTFHSMYVQTATGADEVGMMRFDLSSIPSNQRIVSATLNLYVNSQNGGTDAAYFTRNDAWGETSVSWGTRPVINEQIAFWTPSASGTFIQIDLTAATIVEFLGDGKLSFYIKGQTPNLQNIYATRNSSNKPYLKVVTESATYYNTASAVNTALNNAQPGDTIYIADGTYNNWQITVPSTCDGTTTAPIVLAAQTPGGVTFKGASTRLRIEGDYVIVSGFRFDSIVLDGTQSEDQHVRFVGASYSRLTNCAFKNCGDGQSKAIVKLAEGSNYCRVDHCYFGGSTRMGLQLAILSSTPQSDWSIYPHFDHNWFYNLPESNEKEPIQLAIGAGTGSFSIHALVEWNRFESAESDPETISIKSSDNIIRYNTLLDGTNNSSITNRGGQRNTIRGNFIKNCRQGIRIFDSYNTVINNYVENPSNTPLILYAGKDGGNHAATHNLIANNTFIRTTTTGSNPCVSLSVPNGHGEDIPSTDNTLINNIFQSGPGKRVIDESITGSVDQNTWMLNLAWNGTNPPSNYGVLPPSGVSITDPALSLVDLDDPYVDLYRPTSYYVGTSVSGVVDDMDGQARASSPNIGSDEDSDDAVTAYPILSSEVGPAWMGGVPW